MTDLNELVMGLLTYTDGIHTCNLCGKKSPWRTTMLRHVEANHVETAGHVCDICGQVSKTRHAFAMHKKRKHKVNMDNEPLPDRQPAAAAGPGGTGGADPVATPGVVVSGTTQVTTVVTAEPTK